MSGHGDNLTDDELQSEIELVGDLVVAATSSEGRLPQDEIDRLLGLAPVHEHNGDTTPAEPPSTLDSQPESAGDSQG
ncbi:MAG TPA: hypothetical protein VFJ97_01165 [Dermatophilaceae bacterium]|nr:hypothetical protein [Dermatophilaceae bacterium]